MKRAHLVRQGGLLAALLAGFLLALLAGALGDVLALVVLGSLGLHVVEVVLHRLLAGAFPRQVEIVRGELHARLVLEQTLVLVAILRSGQLSSRAEAVVVVAVFALQALRIAYSGLQLADGGLRQRRAELRNLVAPGTEPLPPRDWSLRVSELVVHAGVLLPLALGWGLLTGSYDLVVPAAFAMVLLALAVVCAAARAVRTLLRLPRGAELLRLVHEAVLRHEPQVMLYSTGDANTAHWIRPWTDVMDNLGRPALIMLRERNALDLFTGTKTPVVCLPEAPDVLPFRLPSARVALFVANGAENARLLRNPVLKSAFIGHGDSDKSSSVNPFTRVYDEVWVAGEAGRQRFLNANVGVPIEKIRVVGRPQIHRIERGAPPATGAPYTVLYAPTWEGVSRDPYDSSLLLNGLDVVRTLLSVDGIRVIYRPHPATGTRNAALARIDEQVTAMLDAAGPSHTVVRHGGPDLYACFNAADALVADVSGVVSDFLASEKPYFVVNGAGLPDEDFRKRVPSAGAAYLVGPGAAGLVAGLSSARGPDPLRERRRALRTYLIGPPVDDPMAVFRSAIDALG
ncbi:MAG: CDP-glycerol glycerophosphotransferase family protein, partial [Actinomycetota bacterium]|nr:CDP-glycerol glycerophosphotransferase family protein [Actinomycetota bacterium]